MTENDELILVADDDEHIVELVSMYLRNMTGGFDATGPVTPGGPLVVLYGDDLAEIIERIEAAGGTIVKPVYEFPGGRRFHFTDPDGYELAVWTAS